MKAKLPPRSRRIAIILGGSLVLALLLGGTALLWVAGYFDRDPVHIYGNPADGSPVAAVYFSGDMGLHLGIGSDVVPELAAHGMPVVGVSTPAIFGHRRDRAFVDDLVADAVRDTLNRTHAKKVVLVGQSYGSDILAAGAPALPDDLRSKVAALVLVVPGRTGYFRADPTGLHYRGTPDSVPAKSLEAARWADIVCIYGAREHDSLCPQLLGSKATVIELPGGHFLKGDSTRLTSAIFTAIGPAIASVQKSHS
ncbi:MAG: type IV secretion system protein VirJ [Sphingomonas sp.]|nr:type IV secretion system protein VirJ [Sphingomonas sp.]